jgi:hypothetical protein
MDATVPPSPWQRRESIQEDIVMSPILDRVPINTFTSIKEKLQSPPPQYHITVTPSNPISEPYKNALRHIQSPLIPLISVTSGQSHPFFPTSLLQYHLLTHPELDDLSLHYHQTEPATEHSWRYPCRVPGWLPPSSMNTVENQRRLNLTLDTKRRRFGRFIGLRGCESPSPSPNSVEGQGLREMEERMEREWLRALERRREEQRLRDKSWRGAW